MTTQELIQKITVSPEAVLAAGNHVVDIQEKIAFAKGVLEGKKADLILSGEINGKNQEARDAQVRKALGEDLDIISNLEIQLKRAQVEYEATKEEAKGFRAIALLLGKED